MALTFDKSTNTDTGVRRFVQVTTVFYFVALCIFVIFYIHTEIDELKILIFLITCIFLHANRSAKKVTSFKSNHIRPIKLNHSNMNKSFTSLLWLLPSFVGAFSAVGTSKSKVLKNIDASQFRHPLDRDLTDFFINAPLNERAFDGPRPLLSRSREFV